LRILQLAQFYDPIIGGEEAHVRTLCRHLVDRGHDVTLITYATADDEGTTRDHGVEVVRVRPTSSRIPFVYSDRSWPHAMPIPDPATRSAISRAVRRLRPDVAHAHNWIANSAVGPLHQAGVPLVTTLHDYSQRCATKRYRYMNVQECPGPALGRCLKCSADKFGTPSGIVTVAGNALMSRRRRDRTAQFMSVSSAVVDRSAPAPAVPAAGVPSVVVPNFIPDTLLEPPIEPFTERAPIVFVGDLTKDKGVDVLVEAYTRLEAPPELVLIGRITAETPDPLPPGVTATGPLPHAEAMARARGASVRVVPSTWQDPCPTVVLEAMAHGRPVVASAAGGIVDMVVDGETGYLVPPSQPDALAEALRAVLAAPEESAAMGRAGRERARQFTVSAVVDRLERIYADCITRAGWPSAAG
jgi:glycogen synthase